LSSSAKPSAPQVTRTKVLIVDDSALVRQVLAQIVSREPDMTVVGAAANPMIAREMIRTTDPDVLTLDIEMPQMDGLDFLDKLMRLRPMPVVMVSTLTQAGSEATLRALELGAVDFVPKPRIDIANGIEAYAQEIVGKLRIAAKVPRRRPVTSVQTCAAPDALHNTRLSTEKLIFVGASTGGTEAVRRLVQGMPADAPALLVTQHMPPGFTRAFAARLDGVARVRVAEAVDGERLLPGHVYIAPGGRHLRVARSGTHYLAELDNGPPVNRHRPSVEVLFRSAASVAGRNAVGIMLTGMGKDGAQAMREMKDAGAYNVAQDEATCVVFGMPREAIAAGAVDAVLPIDGIAADVLGHLTQQARSSRT
jgi:two-component system chemotaxis response regulator CheB